MWDPPRWPENVLARSDDLPSQRIIEPREVEIGPSAVAAERNVRIAGNPPMLPAQTTAILAVPGRRALTLETPPQFEPNVFAGRAPEDADGATFSVALPAPAATALPALASSPHRPGRAKAWRVDAWTAWRQGKENSRVANGRPTAASYGASQAGLLARLDLSDSRHRPQAYFRVTHAPAPFAQSDAALGLGVRPIARLPVRIQAEVRATHSAEQTQVRPAAILVTEFQPAELPLESRLEAYAQTGWVGGDFPTAFVDGQVRIDREIVNLGVAKVRLGAGAWGGAQKFAARLDMGPGVTVDLREAGVPARLSVDYRFRAVGNARPGDGVAVTVSTGF